MDHINEIISSWHTLKDSSGSIQENGPLVRVLEKRLKDDEKTGFIFETREDHSSGFWNVYFLGSYKPDLFSDITGVIALHDINILSAEIFTWRNGSIANILIRTEPLKSSDPGETWKRVKKDLHARFIGRIALTYRLNMKLIPSVPSGYEESSNSPSVIVDNESSDSFTLIKINAQDRLGILYQIISVLNDFRLVTRLAKISTEKGRIEDIFYVHDSEGKKVEGTEQVREIKRSLLHQIS